MAEFVAGEVVVPVVPDATGFQKTLRKQLVPGAYQVGQEIGKEIGRGISDSLKGVYEPLREQTRRQQQQAPKDGAQVGGAFARGVKSAMEAAFRSLPKVELDADSSEAQRKVQDLRTRIETLSGKTVGIDVDAATAQAEVAAIQRELSALDGRDVSVDVRADITAALAELATAQAALSAIDGKTVNARVDVDISGALSSIGVISAALAGLAAIPVGASLAAGLGALTAPLAAAGVGFAGLAAVAVPSVSRIGEALKQQEQAQKAATSATSGAAGAAQQAQIQAINLAAAEERVVDAKRAAKLAEEGLTAARQEAKRAAEDLARTVANAALDEESAALAVEEARQRLAEVEADPKAGELERKRAELAVRQAKQRAKDAEARSKRLREEQKAADKAGIEGSKQVIAAREKIAQANKRVEDSERQLRIMQLQQAAAAQQSAAANRSVAAEVVKLSPAAAKLAKQWKSFSKVYEDWQKSLEPSILPLFGRGLSLVQSLLPKVSPLVRGVSVAIGGLLREMQEGLKNPFWTNFIADITAAAPKAIFGLGKSFGNIATGIAGIIKAFLPFMPTVVGGIEAATAAFSKWGQGLSTSGGFHAFITYVQQNAPKVIEIVKNIAIAIGNLLSGLSGPGAGALDVIVSISQALAGLTPGELQAIAAAAGAVFVAFKAWQGITTVVNGVRASIQTVSSIVNGARAVWGGLGRAAQAAAGVARTAGAGIAAAARTAGSVASKGATAAWTGIQTAATRAGAAARTAGTAIASAGRAAATGAVGLGKVALGYTRIATQALVARARVLATAVAQRAVAAATLVWAAAQRVLNVALKANPIGLIITAIGLLVAGLIYAYQNSETFRNIVQGAFRAIATVAQWLWTNVLQPIWNGLVFLWQNVIAPAAVWLWQSVLKPAWDGIAAAIEWAWTNIIQPAIAALVLYWQTILGPVITWLYENIVKPAWDAISTAIQWAWQNIIQPAVAALVLYWQKVLGPVITWLWNNIVKPAFDGIGAVIKFAWNNIIKPAVAALVLYWQTILGPVLTWLWEKIIKPAWNGISEVIKVAWEKVIQPAVKSFAAFISENLPDGFKKGVAMIEKVWNGLKEVAKKPVNFVIETVYNQGIVKLWNTVADALGLKDLKLSPLPALARGGILPGTSSYRQGDDQLVAMRRGEGVYVSEAMRDPYERARLHAVNKAALHGKSLSPFQGFQGLAGGGIVGDLLASGVRFAAEKLMNPILDQASKAMGGSPWGNMLLAWPKKMVSDVISFLEKKESEAGGPGAQKALAFARAQIGKDYKWGGTGPNVFDCSGLTMRAWQAGGRGDIPRTSQQQMGWVKQIGKPVPGALGFPHPGHVWMYVNPNTIIEAPQTGLKVRQVAARAAQLVGVPPTEYDSGGFLPTGHSLVFNGTGRPEPVLTDRQWQSVRGGAQGGDGSMLNVENFHATPEQSPAAIARELWWLSKGRPR
ncbi:NlpC/P60 family protein [Nonomuraea sp. CA-218870]|uniref:NlpC/P60 family protein n=1 Tax=Nonomuraea sp. CA-218870 TaxID=3239998 RepID=UPI003D8AB29A